MARPPRKGLTYFPMDVDYYDDEKIFALMDTYGPLGSAVYENVLAMVYRQGYYLEVSLDSLAAQITRRIGSRWVRSISQVKEIILHCGRLDLLDNELLCSGVVTSRGIQRRYAQVTIRRRHRDNEYWLLAEEETQNIDNATQTHVTASITADNADNGYTNKTTQNETREKESKAEESIVYQTRPDACAFVLNDFDRDNAAIRLFENKIKSPTNGELLRLDNLCMQYGAARVSVAVEEAASRGVHNLPYIETILSRNYSVPPVKQVQQESMVSADHRNMYEKALDDDDIDILELMEDGAYDVEE